MDIDTYRNKWWIMVAVSLTLFMGAVDGTIVNVALPTLAAEFNASFATVATHRHQRWSTPCTTSFWWSLG